MHVLDREHVISRWRQAEARVYPSVMVNTALYQQYIDVVRGIADELADARTEEDLVAAWHERPELGREVVARLGPTFAPVMDVEAVRDAAFCHRHRAVVREHGRELARRRLEDARRTGAEWVLLFEDVTPLGAHRLEMHVRTGRAVRSSAEVPLDGSQPAYELEVVQLDAHDGTWLLDVPPPLPKRTFTSREEWEARIRQARETFGRD